MFKKNFDKIFNINILIALLGVSIFCVIGLLVLNSPISQNDDNTVFSQPVAYNFNSGWKVTSKGIHKKEDLPLQISYKKNKEYTLTKNIDEILSESDNALCIVTDFSDFSVYLDDKPIYSFKDNRFDKYENIAKNNVYMVNLPDGFQNKDLKIKFKMGTNSSLTYAVKDIFIGERALVTKSLIFSEGFKLIVMSILLIFSALLIFFTLLAIIYKLSNVVNLFCLSIFSVLALSFIFSESNLCLALINNNYLVNSITYLSLMLLPIPLIILAIFYVKNNRYRYLYLCAYLGFSNFIIQVILNHYKIFDYRRMLIATHLVIITIVFSIIISMVYISLEENNGTKDFISHVLPLSIGAVIDIIIFDFKIIPIGAFLSQIGVIIFIFMESRVVARKYNNLYTLSLKSEVYKNIAYTDTMTNVGNRSAYEKKLQSIDKNLRMYGSIWCISLDANNLKVINDSLGHSYGDELIIDLAIIMKNIFEISGDCYRIGGDEFVILLYNISYERLTVLLHRFHKAIEVHNDSESIKLSVALGFDSYDEYRDISIKEVIERSDMKMYKNKKKLKEV